jgi:hypothetical protein
MVNTGPVFANWQTGAKRTCSPPKKKFEKKKKKKKAKLCNIAKATSLLN